MNRSLYPRSVLDNFERVMQQVAIGRCVRMGIDDLAGEFQRCASLADNG